MLTAALGFRGHYGLVATFFLVVLLLQPNNTDLYHYSTIYYEGIYSAESGYNLLQEFMQDLIPNRQIGFEIIKLISPILVFLVFAFSPRRWALMMGSQFLFLSVFNNLRQGFAAVCLLSAVYVLKKVPGPFRILVSTTLFIIATQFHVSSALVGAIVLAVIVSWHNIGARQSMYVLIALSICMTLVVFGFMQLDGNYGNYLRDDYYDASDSRTDPFVKWIVLTLYLLMTTSLTVFDEMDWTEQVAFITRLCCFAVGAVAAFVFSYSELAARVGFYFLAFDAYYLSYLLSTRAPSWRYSGSYVVSNALSPSVTTILFR